MVNAPSSPFEKRPGQTLAWKNVKVTLQKDKRCILHGISGVARPGSLTCLMGHSGAGKTTLLNLLSGKLGNDNSMDVEKQMTLDGVPINPNSIEIKRKMAFVAQRDTLLATATPREAIRFSATLRLSKKTSDEDIDSLVEQLVTGLRLESVADNIIGGEHFRGLSGGEMRRVSLGVELVVCPSIIFLDEVTSGLDSHNAKVVMEVCQNVAQSGAAMIMTIHQPSSAIFELVDQLILLSKGHCLYAGPSKCLPDYFDERGYGIKTNYNPADWAIEVSQTHSMETLKEAGFTGDFPDQLDEDVPVPKTGFGSQSQTDISESDLERGESKIEEPAALDHSGTNDHVSWWTEFNLQLIRDLLNLKRDRRAMSLRFVIVILGSCLISIGFQGVGSKDFRSHVGACFFLVLVNVMALQIILLDFIDQRPLFVREFSTDHFRMLSYGLSKMMVETCSTLFQVLILVLVTYWSLELTGRLWYWLLALFLFAMICTSMGVMIASATADPRNAKELIPITILPQLLLCGFFVNADSFPFWLQWGQWLFPLTYTFRLVVGEEFRYCLDDSTTPVLTENIAKLSICRSFVEDQNATGENEAYYWMALLGFLVVFRWLALILLRRKAN